MSIKRNLFIGLAGAALLAGCSTGAKKEPIDGAVVEERSSEGVTDSTRGLESGTTFQGNPLDDPSSPLANRIVHFAYDSAEVDEAGKETVRVHAQYLAANPTAKVVLEGHADERGSREYNIGLGDRRAQTVRRLMLFQGVTDNQIETVSYGEERPIALGHDEGAWAQNRRVEIIYQR